MRKPRASWTHAAGHQKKGDIGEAGRSRILVGYVFGIEQWGWIVRLRTTKMTEDPTNI